MKIAILSVLLLTAGPAFAQDKFCIDASSREQYNARPISQHEVLAKNAFGADHRAARLGTTCIHIYRESNVALQSMTKCIALGDDVAVSTMGGRSERCKITKVTPAAESYAEAKYKQ
jgi:hypothetical protein